jgi:glycyl-tRNA synthetase
MMFPVPIGFNDEKGYLSPETAQASYLAFKQEFLANREKLPLGLAIIDKAYRNEISPRQMFFRLREFTQAELQIFFNSERINEHPRWGEVKNKKLRLKLVGEDVKEIKLEKANKKLEIPKFYLYYAWKIQKFYLSILKVPEEKFRFRELSKEEKAFYNKIHFDIEVDLSTLGGFKEVGGLHYRTDHDLKGHQEISNKKLEIHYDGRRFIPHVLELSFGVDRNIWMLLDLFYSIGKEGSMFSFPPNLAPHKVAVFPLIKKKKEFREKARDVYEDLNKEFNCFYDESGSIGRRYARQDEIGTPFCITIDGKTLEDNTVTIRNRDNQKQVRVKVGKLKDVIKKLVSGGDFDEVREEA